METERAASDSGVLLSSPTKRMVSMTTHHTAHKRGVVVVGTVDPANQATPAALDYKIPLPGRSLVECTISTPPIGLPGDEASGGASRSTLGVVHGMLQITVRHDMAPIASQVFLDLVHAHHFDGVFIFRVLPGFIAQWGVRTARVPGLTKPPKTKDTIVSDQTLSNVRGTLSFAGGNPATEQVFVNLGNNQRLDKENSRPFATVASASMPLLDQLYTGYKDGQGQIKTIHQGEAAMREAFPRMSRVEVCQAVPVLSTTGLT